MAVKPLPIIKKDRKPFGPLDDIPILGDISQKLRELTPFIPHERVQQLEGDPRAQMLMGFLGPPGHKPAIGLLGDVPDAAKVLRDVINAKAALGRMFPGALRGTRAVRIRPEAPTNRMGEFLTATGDIDLFPNTARIFEEPIGRTAGHELIHGLDRAAFEAIAPQRAKWDKWSIFSELMEDRASDPRSRTDIEAEFILRKIKREIFNLKFGAGAPKYGGLPLYRASIPEQFATAGGMENPPPILKTLLTALSGILEGKY